MISIISCSRDPKAVARLGKNIEETIGVPFEFLPFDNSSAQWGICKVYNHQAERARGELVCFIHDDVYIKTKNWGKILEEVFATDDTIGLVGLAGAGYKTITTSTWSAAPKELLLANVYEHKKFRRQNSGKIGFVGNGSSIQLAINLDGFFLVATKDVVSKNRFDDILLNGFHAYDIDYSLQVGANNKLLIINTLEVEHFSDGNPDLGWLTDADKVTQKWKQTLPRSITPLTYLEKERQEYKAFAKAISVFVRSRPFPVFYFLTWIVKNFRISYFIVFLIKSKIDQRLRRLA